MDALMPFRRRFLYLKPESPILAVSMGPPARRPLP